MKPGAAAGLGATLAMVGCAKPPPPKIAFIDSRTFMAIRANVYGILQTDGDSAEAIVVHKTPVGFVPVLYERIGHEQQTWSRDCSAPLLHGDELEAMRWIDTDDGQLALVMASDRNPDTVVQHFALLDMSDDCAVRYEEKLRLDVPSGDVIAPASVPGGVAADPDGGLHIVDQAKLVELQGAEGSVSLLLSVRDRLISGPSKDLQIHQRLRPILLPRKLTVAWTTTPEPQLETPEPPEQSSSSLRHSRVSGNPANPPQPHMDPRFRGDDEAKTENSVALPEPLPDSMDLPELTDTDESTAFVIRVGHRGSWRIEADDVLALIELHYGCGDAAAPALILRRDDRTYVTGQPPEPNSFVLAAGRTHAAPGKTGWRDLFALRQPAQKLILMIEPSDSKDRCIHELLGFGFNEP